MKKTLTVVIGVFFLLLFVAPLDVSGDSPPKYFVDESKLPFDAIPGIETKRFWGIHNGAGYRVEVPETWNGDLVMYAHGFRGTGLELSVDEIPARSWFVANGYAWAASSYSKNAYDVAQGAKDTHALTQFFNDLVGKPNRIYIAGASMGGHVTAVAIEQWPQTYNGAIIGCGVLGDYELFDFYLDFNLVALALAGVEAVYPPPDDYLTVTVPNVKANLELSPETFPFTLNAKGLDLMAMTKMQSGGERPVFNQGFLFWNGFVPGDHLFGVGTAANDWLTRVRGIAVDNADTIYQFDADPSLSPEEAALNQAVLRVAQDRSARNPNGLHNVPVISGDVSIPVLTLHTLGDLTVPFSMEQLYAQRVAEHGASDLLVQRAIRDFGHCTFTPTEYLTGFADLVNWVVNDVKPDGDDVLNPTVVADPNFGCAFSEDRVYPPPLDIPSCP